MTDTTRVVNVEETLVIKSSSKPKSFVFYRNSTFLGLLVGYAGYYLCRQNLSVAYLPMKSTLGMDAITFGSISSFGTFIYALGKVATGPLADAKGGKFVFFLGLMGSVAASLLFSFGTGITFFVGVWGLNRLFQSMGWGGLINVMSRWFSKRSYGTAMGFMSINYQFGGVVATLFAGLILSWGLGWQALFIIPAALLACVGLLIRPMISGSPEEVGYSILIEQDPNQTSVNQDKEELSYLSRFKQVLADRMFLVMCALSFILTLLRECFNLWMPEYFSEMGASASTAAFKSAVFPLLGCIGTMAAGWFSDRFLEGRRGPLMAFLMVGLAVSLLGLGHIQTVSSWMILHFSPLLNQSAMAMILVGATGFFLLGAYSFVGGVSALDFGGRKTAGTAAGLLDGVGYLGAMLAGIGLAKVLGSSGWVLAYSLMAVLAVIGIGLCVIVWQVKPRS